MMTIEDFMHICCDRIQDILRHPPSFRRDQHLRVWIEHLVEAYARM